MKYSDELLPTLASFSLWPDLVLAVTYTTTLQTSPSVTFPACFLILVHIYTMLNFPVFSQNHNNDSPETSTS